MIIDFIEADDMKASQIYELLTNNHMEHPSSRHGSANIYVDCHDGIGPRPIKRAEVHLLHDGRASLVIVPESRDDMRRRKGASS